jgi:hypothetical protein
VFDHDLNGTGTCGPFRPYIALGNIYACGFASNKRLGLCKNSLAGFGSVRTTVAYGQDAGGYSWEFRMQHNVGQFQYLAHSGNDIGAVIDGQISPSMFGNPDLVSANVGG